MRPLLLVLLWVWALCVFTVVDLFWNVAEFDDVRPRAALYRGMRIAAHKLVGESCLDAGAASLGRRPAPGVAAATLVARHRDRLDARRWEDVASAVARGGGGPDAAAVRAAAEEALAAAARPGARYRGGVAAMRVAARLGDARTWDLFLALLEARDRVVAKLPLTERRDDLDFLDVTLSAVAREGTPDQRARLATWTAEQLRTESDAAARARLTRCLATLKGDER